MLIVGRIRGARNKYEAVIIQPADEGYDELTHETRIRPGEPGCHIDLDWSPGAEPRPSEFIDEFMEIFDDKIGDRWLPTSGAGSRGVGETFEAAFAVTRNNSTGPDWKDLEFKCSIERAETTSRPKGLFLKEPTWIDGTRDLNERVERYGYPDEQERSSCFHAARIKPSKHGFALRPMHEMNRLELLHNNTVVAYWDIDALEEKLSEKLNNTVFARAKSRGAGEAEEFRYIGIRYCANPSGRRFMDCIANGAAWVEIRIGPRNSNDNRNKNWGCQFRVMDSTLGEIFSRIEILKDPKLK